MHPVADKYGLIVVTNESDEVDKALEEVLRKFAIDPEKIALIGRCASGWAALNFATSNLGLFSRGGAISGNIEEVAPTVAFLMNPEGNSNQTSEYFLDSGMLEPPHLRDDLELARALRQGGRPVKLAVTLRGHEHQAEDYDFLGHWLQESWTIPDPKARPRPAIVADPVPRLTTEALAKLTAFWTRFLQEPDSIRRTARRAHLHEVQVPVGEERPSTWIVDMPALAARYPSVAAALKQAGLTAQQHDAYRVALISALIAKSVEGIVQTDPTSVLAENLAFIAAHEDELAKFAAMGIEHPEAQDTGDTTPDEAESFGMRGIWRTP